MKEEVRNDFEGIKYFKEEEFRCPCCGKVKVSRLLLENLDRMREIYKKPIIISSGYRCRKHNKEVGGKTTSAHLKGMAADILCPSNEDRYLLVGAAILAGFRRIGIGKRFIHVDVDYSKPYPRIWLYE